MNIEGKKVDFSAPLHDIFHKFRDANGNDADIPEYKGEVGIEIEVEGRRLPKVIPSYWHYHRDGSLRGEENAEYVLRQPCRRASVRKFLDYLNDQFEKAKSKIDESNRTSVHVHINMNNKSLTECYTYMILYFIFEDLMSNIAGESRVGNLFCLRAGDAEYFVDVLAKFAKLRKFNPNPEQLRYTSVNACAITKFNSIEFRALRGTTDAKVITEWVDLLLALKDASLEYKQPNEIVENFSMLGAERFIRKTFPQHHALFLRQQGYEDSMWEAARLVQEIAYATDWSKEVKPKRMFEVRGPEPDLDDGDD